MDVGEPKRILEVEVAPAIPEVTEPVTEPEAVPERETADEPVPATVD